jgi:membrane dipeptidase
MTAHQPARTSPATVPVFDGHNDTAPLVLAGHDVVRGDRRGHIDLPRARSGGLVGGLCAVFVKSKGAARQAFLTGTFPPTPTLDIAQAEIIDQISALIRLQRESNGAFAIATSADEIERLLEAKVFAAVLHLEGAEAIDSRLRTLDVLYAAGLRSIGPLWSRPNRFGHGVPISYPGSPDSGPGLTRLGRQLISACNELRILVDVSHMTERGFWDVVRISDAPLVATHSNAHKLTQTPRNLTDRQLDAIKASDGIVGINFAVDFVRRDGRRIAATPLDAVAQHVEYVADRIGIDHVGFGSDFDGALIPKDLGDAAGLPTLIDRLRQRGFGDHELRSLACTNWLRVLRQIWGS